MYQTKAQLKLLPTTHIGLFLAIHASVSMFKYLSIDALYIVLWCSHSFLPSNLFKQAVRMKHVPNNHEKPK